MTRAEFAEFVGMDLARNEKSIKDANLAPKQ